MKIIKTYNIRGPDVVFKVEYLWNDWVKKKGSQRQSSQMRFAWR